MLVDKRARVTTILLSLYPFYIKNYIKKTTGNSENLKDKRAIKSDERLPDKSQ